MFNAEIVGGFDSVSYCEEVGKNGKIIRNEVMIVGTFCVVTNGWGGYYMINYIFNFP